MKKKVTLNIHIQFFFVHIFFYLQQIKKIVHIFFLNLNL